MKLFFGLGHTRTQQILFSYGIHKDCPFYFLRGESTHIIIKRILDRIKFLSFDYEFKREKIGEPLLKKMELNISNHILLRTYKGLRHFKGFPVRGQKTRRTGKKREGAKGFVQIKTQKINAQVLK